jgi:hypothetical protein
LAREQAVNDQQLVAAVGVRLASHRAVSGDKNTKVKVQLTSKLVSFRMVQCSAPIVNLVMIS